MHPTQHLTSAPSTRGVAPARPAKRGALGPLARSAARALLRTVPDAPIALVLPSGDVIAAPHAQPRTRLVFRDTAALLGVLGPRADVHFGDAYAAGRIDVEGDLLDLLIPAFERGKRGGPLGRVDASWTRLTRRRNSLRRSRANVHHHYDLGNDFYALWLDRRMVYTCAYFAKPGMDLEEAQLAKMEHVARKLRLRPDERVTEAGCGWGSLAIHLARHHGVRVRAFNISEEQMAWARERVRAEGLEGRVELVLDDYRNAGGPCDAFVSIGMLEHVGPEHYADLARVIDRAIGPSGRGLLHFIGRHRPAPFNAWVERRIFPGAHAPTLREVADVLEPADVAIADVENLRPHYAHTLEHWLGRFEARCDEVRRRFGEEFVRIWRLYLAGSIASFRTGSLQLYQVLFTRASDDRLPWTRADLYTDG
jgi:cyclopropane-fatty-acyl-phospholipid synthase